MRARSAYPIASLLCLALISCPRVWHVAILDVDDALNPLFCVSSRDACKGSPVGLSSFGVSRIVDTVVEGEAFRDYETVWGIQAFSDVPLGRFKYGEVPDGWREAIPPKPLEAGALYSVGEYWFRLNPGPPVTWTLERGRPPEGSPTT